MKTYSVIGKSVPNVDGISKATGEALYVADIKIPGMFYGKILRSRYPHARILNIDTNKAKRLPGVAAVVTSKDTAAYPLYGVIMRDKPIFARDRVRYMGDEVAGVVAGAGFGTEADFLKAAIDADLVHTHGINAETFEGYLFPDTYYFPRDATPEKIISTMVKRFWSVFRPEWKNQAKSLEFSIHQLVTLASMIEKETGEAFERPIISSVFHNRLKRGMRLESDPTVIYGIQDFDGNLTRKHLAEPTPYNTYTIKGLPPGPIASTGIKSLEAALYPADTQFLYFVSKKDNTHQFSANFKDHNRAVRKYQLSR